MKDLQTIPTNAQNVQHWKMISLPMAKIGPESNKVSQSVHQWWRIRVILDEGFSWVFWPSNCIFMLLEASFVAHFASLSSFSMVHCDIVEY